MLFLIHFFLFVCLLSTARRTRNAQPARQTTGVRFAADGPHAPAFRVPAPRAVGATVAAAAPTAPATAAVRRARVADGRAPTVGRRRRRRPVVAEVQSLGWRRANVRRPSRHRRPLAVHGPEQRGPVVDVRGAIPTGQCPGVAPVSFCRDSNINVNFTFQGASIYFFFIMSANNVSTRHSATVFKRSAFSEIVNFFRCSFHNTIEENTVG